MKTEKQIRLMMEKLEEKKVDYLRKQGDATHILRYASMVDILKWVLSDEDTE